LKQTAAEEARICRCMRVQKGDAGRTRRKSKTAASWRSTKSRLRDFDRTALLGLLQDLYAANKDNQVFLHARLKMGDDPLWCDFSDDSVTGG
jgi:hypothetical protein